VYEAKMLFPEQVKTIYASVDNIAGESLRSAIDLTYENYSDAEERYSFLAFLAKQIQYTTHLAYEETAGLSYFRAQLSEYFRYYLHVNVQEQQIVITPSRKELIEALLSNYCPKLTLVAKSLAHFIAKDFDHDKTQILQTPSSVELIVKLVNKLKPQLIITHLDQHELQSTQLVEQLIQCAIQTDALLVLDLTDAIDLSSDPDIHGIYRYLSDKTLPDNLIMMAGLVNNHVYQNFSLNITISSNKTIIKHLTDSAELTYSRTPVLKQFYYAHLLEQLLYFQRTRTTDTTIANQKNTRTSTSLKLCSHAKKAFMHPAILSNHLTFNDETVRLDFGENELPAPEVLKQTLFESYLVRKCVERETSAQTALQSLLSQRFNFPVTHDSSLIFANGVAPIYSALLNMCKRANQTLLIPSGSYGYFVAAAQYKGLNVEIINTDEKDSFKLTAEHLLQVLKNQKPCWLFLNAPIVNPTGAIYSDSELSALFAIAAEYNTTIIIDCIFSGLEYQAMQKYDFHNTDASIVLLGGVSKEYAAGGLRFAYACSNNKNLAATLTTEINQLPHTTVNYAIRKLVELQLQKETTLMQHLQQQKSLLSTRAKILTGILQDKGWKVITPSGGLFLVAKPQKFIQKSGLSAIDAGDKITEELFKHKNVVINNSTWTGLPGYCRFVLSSSQESFDMAIKRLKTFEI
jgi:methionine S-methyltransferase